MNIDAIKKVGVIGSGSMGEGIVQGFAEAGLGVRVFARRIESLTNCVNGVAANLKLFAEFGLLKEEPAAILARIETTQAHEMENVIGDCQFVVESIPEVLEQKREMFTRLCANCAPDAILTSNTSSFTMSLIADGMSHPERIVGLHYFIPAHIVPLVEIHRGKDTTEEALEITRQLMDKIGKTPVIVRKESSGLIVNRIQTALVREATCLVDQGIVTPEDLDRATKASYGFRLASLGPFAQLDINGLDTVMRGNQQVYKVICNSTDPSPTMAEKVDKGNFGLKSGKGFYDYSNISKEQVIEKRDRNLLKQLVLYRQTQQGK